MQNKSAVKGVKTSKVPEVIADIEERKGAQQNSNKHHNELQAHRRMTLFDLPMSDDGRFESLTTSAVNHAKKNKKKSVLVECVNDF